MMKLLRPAWMNDQEWLVTKVGVLYTLAALLLLWAWWKGYLRDMPR
jgi:hypothetical protein